MPRLYKYEASFLEQKRLKEAAEMALSEIRLLHAPIQESEHVCHTCSECKHDYRCRTVEIIDRVLKEQR